MPVTLFDVADREALFDHLAARSPALRFADPRPLRSSFFAGPATRASATA